MLRREISMDWEKSRSTRGGRVKGTRRDEKTTITSTSGVFAWSRVEIKGATTPVEIPLRSSAERLYSGQNRRKRRATPRGKRIMRMQRNKRISSAECLTVFEIWLTLMERKLRKRRLIMQYRGKGWKTLPVSGKRIPATSEE
jgi:hypothetical protein